MRGACPNADRLLLTHGLLGTALECSLRHTQHLRYQSCEDDRLLLIFSPVGYVLNYHH